VAWPEVFMVFLLSHFVGDFAFQTDWQAQHKKGGLGGDSVARRALLSHVTTYTLAFVPALVWLAGDIGAWALLAAAGVALPHLIQDDGRLIDRYVATVKGPTAGDVPLVFIAVDQTFHALALFALSLAVVS